ncbi:MAG: flagellar hook capping FlgD N-terminal domain-containing protein [Pseudomonadota bacterium]
MTTALQDIVSASSKAAGTAKSSSLVSTGETQDRFLKLLVSQMRNQDPLNPLDNAQVTTQMAQISTVSGIDKLNVVMSQMSSSLLSNQSLQAASLIGRSVLADGNRIDLVDGSAIGGVSLGEPADKVRITIKDKSGNIMQAMDLGSSSGGVMTFQWDGATSSGTAAASGSYVFQVDAERGGQKVKADALGLGQVNSVSLGDEILLNVGNLGALGVSQIKQVL